MQEREGPEDRREGPEDRRASPLSASSLRVRDLVMVVVYVVTLAAAWGAANQKLDALEGRVGRFETRMDVQLNRIERRVDQVLSEGRP